jgi:putative transposase
MIEVERHFTTGNAEIVRLCRTSAVLYNRCNYHMRKAFFANRFEEAGSRPPLPDISTLIRLMEGEGSYNNLHNTKTAKQTIRQCLTDWTNYFKALKAYGKNPESFIFKPKPPFYKNKMAQVIFYDETIKRKPRKSGFVEPTNGCFRIRSDKQFKQVVITPKRFGFVIEVRYEITPKPHRGDKLDKQKLCCIDIGVNTLAAVTIDQQVPILVNGRILKSINQWYNKQPGKKRNRKRYWRLENYFHHASKMVIDLCLAHGVGKIVIGKNDGWKQEMDMGKKNNQHFQFIPFDQFLQKIQYKAFAVGIEVVFTEESYTSKASYFDSDPLDGSRVSGSRKKRGLYVAIDGFAVNADVNGSLNIGRKVIGESERIADRSLAARPVRVNPLKASTYNGGKPVGSTNSRSLAEMLKVY